MAPPSTTLASSGPSRRRPTSASSSRDSGRLDEDDVGARVAVELRALQRRLEPEHLSGIGAGDDEQRVVARGRRVRRGAWPPSPPPGMTSLPAKWPQRLGNTWSSSWMALAPRRCSARTVRRTLSGPPNPVSASTTIGIVTASRMASTVSPSSVRLISPRSGTPSRALVTPAPVMYTASKPSDSTTRAVSASGAPGRISGPPPDRMLSSSLIA